MVQLNKEEKAAIGGGRVRAAHGLRGEAEGKWKSHSTALGMHCLKKNDGMKRERKDGSWVVRKEEGEKPCCCRRGDGRGLALC